MEKIINLLPKSIYFKNPIVIKRNKSYYVIKSKRLWCKAFSPSGVENAIKFLGGAK
jgi:hypothetical protein